MIILSLHFVLNRLVNCLHICLVFRTKLQKIFNELEKLAANFLMRIKSVKSGFYLNLIVLARDLQTG